MTSSNEIGAASGRPFFIGGGETRASTRLVLPEAYTEVVPSLHRPHDEAG
jgi:hypothetical protein